MSPIRSAVLAVSLAASLLTGHSALAQQTLTLEENAVLAEMQALQARVAVDKRAFIADQLDLSEAQAAKFWPIYGSHQKMLAKINVRRMENILAYARAWNAGSLSDAQAWSLGEAALKIERDEVALLERTWKQMKGVIPGATAVRYLQIESKLRAIVRFEQAAQVPLAD